MRQCKLCSKTFETLDMVGAHMAFEHSKVEMVDYILEQDDEEF